VHVEACKYPTETAACAKPGCDGDLLHPAEVCDGAGHCSEAGAVSCAPYTCGETACLTSCDGDEDCDAHSWCQAGQCVPRLGNSTACERDAACASGHCADGVCCDAACDGPCDLCNVPGRAGLCSPAPAGSEPQPAVCGELRCNGKTASCPPECLSTADCRSGATCEENKCLAREANGQSCARDERCTSGHCVDGVCCDTSCQGTCATCRSAETPGICTNVNGPPLPGRGLCTGTGACAGKCDGSGPECHYPDLRTVCGVAASCVEAVETEASVCDGRGGCLVGPRHECPTGCDGVRCGNGTLRTDDSGCSSARESLLGSGMLLVYLFRRRRAAHRP
jgi:hypothetical protein